MALTMEAAKRKDETRPTAGKLEHRHFAFIAATLASSEPDKTWLAEHDTWREIVADFADACAKTNPRFDRARFLRACGVVL